jgi:putative addiction module antidote
MSRSRITTSGNSAAILLPQDVLEQLGLKVGDEIDMAIVERALILRPLDEAEREIDDTTNDVFERRKSAYEQLAKGIE